MMHRIVALLLIAGCADQEGKEAEALSTRLRGEVFFGEPGQRWTIEAFEVGENGEEAIVEGASSEDGTFEIELGYRAGTTYVAASNESQDRVSVFVDAPLGATTEVVLTPVTHLAAMLAEQRIREGSAVDGAIATGKELVFGHFAGIAHDRVRPYDVTAEPAVSFTDDVAVGFLLQAFDTLAAGWGDGAAGAVSAGRLLDALSADLLADGRFDGMGDRSRAIDLAGRPLGASILRAELGRALLAFAESTENVTAFSRADLQPMAEALAENRSEIFPDGSPEALDDVPPSFRQWWFEKDGVRVPADRPLSGAVGLVIEVADDSQVERIGVQGEGISADAGGRTLARFDLDIAAIVDGPSALEVLAADEHGNEGRLSIGFEIDNTAPILRVGDIGRVAGSTVTVSGEVEDRGEVEVRVGLSNIELGRLATMAGPFSLDVQVVCGRRFVLAIEAIDRAGNRTEVQKEVLCDATAPVIEVLSTSFVQEGSLVAIHDVEDGGLAYLPGPSGIETVSIDASTAWPIRVEKYFNRLDDLDDLGVLGAGPNIPRLRLRAVELDGQVVASRWETLTVEYRYLVDGLERRPSQRLRAVGGLPEYEVPFAYQWLGPELAASAPSALHEIEVRAVDEAGLSSVRRFGFSVALLAPPILLSACAKSPVLGSFELGLQNLGVLYGTQPESEAVTAALGHPLHLPPGSLAPSLPARAVLAAPSAATRIVAFSEDKHLANPNHPDNNRPGLNCLSGSHSEVERPSGQYLGCFLGPMPASRELIRDGQGLNDAGLHMSRVEVRQSGAVLAADAGGGYALLPDRPFEARVFLVAPRARFGGVEYDWRTAFTLPNGYQFGPHPVRYRVDAAWHEGIERPPYGSFDPPRAYVTRPFVSEIEIEIASISASAEIEGRPDILVGIQYAASCSAPIIHRTVAP